MLPAAWNTERLHCRDVTPDDLPRIAQALAQSPELHALDPSFGPATDADIQGHIDRHLQALLPAAPDPAQPTQGCGNSRAVQMQMLQLRTATQARDEQAGLTQANRLDIGFWRLVRVPSRPQAIGVEILLMRPEHRRAGLGQELVAGALEQLRGVGVELWARVYLANARALSFWMRAGLRRVVEHQGDLVHGLSTEGRPNLILSREIPPARVNGSSTASTDATADGVSHTLEGRCHCGALGWRLQGIPESATACNCTVCRRYGVLWAYGHEGQDITVQGPSAAYRRGSAIEFHFCPTCGCVSHWRAQAAQADGQRRIAVNLRLTDPDPIRHLPIDHFDGLDAFDDLPRDGKCVGDLWA